MATQIVAAPAGADHQGQCSARTARGMRTPTGDYMTCAGGHAAGDPHGASFGGSGWFTWTDDRTIDTLDTLAHEAASYVRPTVEVRQAVARFQAAARTVKSFDGVASADMTPDQYNTWYDKLTVMREARAFLEAAGQLHLVVAS